MPETMPTVDIEREIRNLNAILEVSKAMSSEVQLDSLLQVIMQKTIEVMEAERTSLFLYDEGRQELWSKIAQELGPSQEIRFPVGVGIAGQVAQTRQGVNLADVYQDPRFNPDFDKRTGYRTRSLLCLPLLSSTGKLIGVIQVLNKKGRSVFDEKDESLLAAFGAHAAVALERAQLIEAYVEKQRMEETLKLAREIQMSMLPKHFPPFPHRSDFDLYAFIEPAREVGGDFYDFLLLDEDHLGFAIGDVSGKGIPAALFMSVTKTWLRVIASKQSRPAAVLAELNTELCRDNDAGMFVTLFYGILHLRTGALEYSSGGHNPPYVLTRTGAVEPLAKTKGMALGVLRDTSYQATTRQLRAGDEIFLYTDGVTEAMDRAYNQFSDHRLLECLTRARGLSPTALIRNVIKELQQFSSGAEQSDDITALAIHYLGDANHGDETQREPLTIFFKNQLSEIGRLAQGVTAFAEQRQLPSPLVFELNVALEEILTNVISYGYEDAGEHEILLRLSYTGEKVTAEVEDDGRPFNPLAAAAPDTSKPLVDRPVGGLGIHLVRKIMDEVEYSRQQGKNRLVMTKRIPTTVVTAREG
ncbi:MAG: SpoIIE family protein phosphatase [Deltaproteobacteria bacterium]|nr:SpoIIE family protein phosphatase [Deltaproteobacteria bacterium]